MRAYLFAGLILATAAHGQDQPLRLPETWLSCEDLGEARYAWKLLAQDPPVAHAYVSRRMESSPGCMAWPPGTEARVMERLTIDKVSYECLRIRRMEGCYWAHAVTDLIEARAKRR